MVRAVGMVIIDFRSAKQTTGDDAMESNFATIDLLRARIDLLLADIGRILIVPPPLKFR